MSFLTRVVVVLSVLGFAAGSGCGGNPEVAFKGPLADFVYQMVGGLRAGMALGPRSISAVATSAWAARRPAKHWVPIAGS